MLKAVEYKRYSSDNQDFASIEAQTRAIAEYCEKNNIQIVKSYIDEAFSAKTDDRPAFLEMMKDCEKGIFDVVLVHKFDRFARNRYDSAFYKKKLKDNKVKLISVLEPLDDTPESVILEAVLEAFSEYYSLNLAREIKKGMKENAYKCKFNGGFAPLGYSIKEGEYIINEFEANIIKEIFNLYLNNYGYKSIAVELNNRGYKTRFKKKFSKNSIRDILMNKKYVGINEYFKNSNELITVEGVIPCIISKEQFDEVQNKLGKNLSKPKVRKVFYMLTGYIICGECGSNFSGNSTLARGKRYPFYSCGSKDKKNECSNPNLRKEKIEPYILNEIKNKILSDEVIEAIIQKMKLYLDSTFNKVQAERIFLDEKIKNNKNKIDKILELYSENLIDKSLLTEKIGSLKKELSEQEIKLIDLKYNNVEAVSENDLRNFLISSREYLENNDDKIKRKLIELFVKKIIVYKSHIEVIFKVPSVSGKVGAGDPLLTFSEIYYRTNIK